MSRVLTRPRLKTKTPKASTADQPQRVMSEQFRDAIRRVYAARAHGEVPIRMQNPKIRAAVELMDETSKKLKGVKFDSVKFIRKMRGPLE